MERILLEKTYTNYVDFFFATKQIIIIIVKCKRENNYKNNVSKKLFKSWVKFHRLKLLTRKKLYIEKPTMFLRGYKCAPSLFHKIALNDGQRRPLRRSLEIDSMQIPSEHTFDDLPV